jgi:D-tyrosyl-tRNA(Tyr) deacylase
MRVVLQRVSKASVSANGKVTGKIEKGLLILVGFENNDTDEDIEWMVNKILKLRVFNDIEGVMNLSVTDVDGEILVVSQFTLHAKTKKGNRPSYIMAAHPDIAIPLYKKFIERFEIEAKKTVRSGIFGAMMKVSLENDGPVTIIIDTKNKE